MQEPQRFFWMNPEKLLLNKAFRGAILYTECTKKVNIRRFNIELFVLRVNLLLQTSLYLYQYFDAH